MRKAFLVYVDLDNVPGVMYSQESAQNVIRQILNDRIPHYNPLVSLAPGDFQPLDGIEVRSISNRNSQEKHAM